MTLTQKQRETLEAVAYDGNCTTTKAVANHLHIKKTTAASRLASLERKGAVRKMLVQRHWKFVYWEMTQAGIQALEGER